MAFIIQKSDCPARKFKGMATNHVSGDTYPDFGRHPFRFAERGLAESKVDWLDENTYLDSDDLEIVEVN